MANSVTFGPNAGKSYPHYASAIDAYFTYNASWPQGFTSRVAHAILIWAKRKGRQHFTPVAGATGI